MADQEVFAVVLDGEGAHEPEAVLSVWDTEDAARADAERILTEHNKQMRVWAKKGGWEHKDEVYSYVISFPLNKPGDVWLN